jgi:predicted house-cleaning noncanonical NTP pyrophosphatase (MazG superfamily)
MDIAERECVQKLLETKLPHEVYEEINDKDLDNLVKSGFTIPHVLAAAGRDDLVRVLLGQLGRLRYTIYPVCIIISYRS